MPNSGQLNVKLIGTLKRHAASLKKKYRKRGSQYTLSPFALVYSDENHYLLAYDAQLKEIRNYRVDRMENVSCVEGSVRDGKEEFAAIDMTKYQKYTFGMYSGEVKEVTMVFTNNMVNAVADRFGRDIMIHKEDGYHFRVSVPVAVSPQFYGWVFGLGKMVRIVGPEDVRQGYTYGLCIAEVMMVAERSKTPILQYRSPLPGLRFLYGKILKRC